MRARWPLLLLIGAAALAGCLAPTLPAAQDRLLYNHSPSVPVGLYVRTDQAPARGAFVTVLAADVAPEMARRRSFDGARDRFIKRVAAAAGDHVCAEGQRLSINGVTSVTRRSHDSDGNALDLWNDCRVLQENEVLLLGDTPDSFDGRYWGPVALTQIEGVWRPLSQ